MKKGFVMYYDNCRRLERLSDKQYAAAMKCVVAYTERLANGEDAENYLKQRLAELSAEAAMAVSFMTDDARRDHEKYLETIARRGRKKTGSAEDELMKYAKDLQKTVPKVDAEMMNYL